MSQSSSNTEIPDSQGPTSRVDNRAASASPPRRKRRKTEFETAMEDHRDEIRITLEQDDNVDQLLKEGDTRAIPILNQKHRMELRALTADVNAQLRKFHDINEEIDQEELVSETLEEAAALSLRTISKEMSMRTSALEKIAAANDAKEQLRLCAEENAELRRRLDQERDLHAAELHNMHLEADAKVHSAQKAAAEAKKAMLDVEKQFDIWWAETSQQHQEEINILKEESSIALEKQSVTIDLHRQAKAEANQSRNVTKQKLEDAQGLLRVVNEELKTNRVIVNTLRVELNTLNSSQSSLKSEMETMCHQVENDGASGIRL